MQIEVESSDVIKDNWALPLLHRAVRAGKIDRVKFLLSCKCNPDVLDANGRTPLFRAVTQDNITIANILLNHNADPNAADFQGQLPLHEACKRGNNTVASLLIIRGATLEKRNNEQFTPIQVAAKNGQVKLLTFLLEVYNAQPVLTKDGGTLMHLAAESKCSDTVALLYKKGFNVNAYDDRGLTPLHIAVAKYGNICVVFALLDNGANRFTGDYQGRMPVEADVDEYFTTYDAVRKCRIFEDMS